jgi:hypothetical protein
LPDAVSEQLANSRDRNKETGGDWPPVPAVPEGP